MGHNKKLRYDRIAIVAIVLIAIILFVPFIKQDGEFKNLFGMIKGSSQDIIAKVNNEVISVKEFEDSYNKLSEQQKLLMTKEVYLNQSVDLKLLMQEANKENIQVSEDEINEVLDDIKTRVPEGQTLEELLALSNSNLEELKKNIRDSLILQKLIDAKTKVVISEEQMKAFFDENKELMNTPEMVNASHILVKTEEEAEQVLDKLNSGEDFCKLAYDYSFDFSNTSCGNLGFFGKGEMVSEFEDAAFALDVGEVSKAVKTDFGYHIIRLEDKTEAKEANYEELKEDIKSLLEEQERVKLLNTYLEELRSKASIKVYYEKI